MAKKQTPTGGAPAAETTIAASETSATVVAEGGNGGAADNSKVIDPPPAPTPEEIEARVEEMSKTLFRPVNSFENARIQEERENAAPPAEDLPQSDAPEGGESDRSAEPEAEAEPAAEPAAETEKPATETPPAKPTEERFVPGAVTPEQVEATARRVAQEEMETRQPEPDPQPEPTPASDEAALPYAAKKHLTVLKEVAAANPAFKDLPARQKEFWKKEEKLIAQWEQQNPGSRFDPDAAEHAEFYRKNQPFVPDEEFDAAKEALIARAAEERAYQRFVQEQEPVNREIKKEKLERIAAPEIANSIYDAAEEIFASVPQFKEVFKPGELSKAAVAKIDEINPVVADAAHCVIERTAVKINELERLDRGIIPLDYNKVQDLKRSGDVIVPHRELEVDCAEAEAELLKKTERNGKKLISTTARDQKAAQMAARVPNFQRMRPEQQLRVFIKAREELSKTFDWLQTSDTKAHILTKAKARVAQIAERFSKSNQSQPENRTADLDKKNGAPQNQKPAVTPAKPSGKQGLARGTSAASSSDVLDNAPRSQSALEKTTEYLEKRAFR